MAPSYGKTIWIWIVAFSFIVCMHAQLLSHVWLFVTPWNVAHQASQSMGLSWQVYCSWLPFPPPGDLPHPGTECASPVSLALVGRFFTTEPPGKHLLSHYYYLIDQINLIMISNPMLEWGWWGQCKLQRAPTEEELVDCLGLCAPGDTQALPERAIDCFMWRVQCLISRR